MSDYRTVQIYQNVVSGAIFDSAGNQLANGYLPFIKTNETIIVDIQYLNSDTLTDVYLGWASKTIAGSASIDNNFKHVIAGALTIAKSGAVTAIVATITDTDYINATGILQLVNASGLSETVDYSAYTKTGTTYTFTVSATLTNSYAIADVCNVADAALAQTIPTDFDFTHKDTGRLIITVTAYNAKFYHEILNAESISNCALEVQIFDSTPAMIFALEFEIMCLNIRQYYGVVPPQLAGNFYTKAEIAAILTEYVSASALAAYQTLANLSVSVSSDATSDTKYPSVKAIKDYADGLVVGLIDDRGNYNASVNTFPATGGSGTAGAILKGDLWFISVAGTLGTQAVGVGDQVRAIADTPGQTESNWAISQANITYVPENVTNKVTSISGSSTDTQYPSAKLTYDQLALKAPLSNPTFTGTVTTPALTCTVATGTGGALFETESTTQYVFNTMTAGNGSSYLYQFSQSYSTSGRYIAASALLDSSTAGGLGLAASNAAGIIRFWTSTTEKWRISAAGNLSNTGADATAYIQLKAGTATAGTAPLKLTSGTNLTAVEAGAVEFDGTNLYFSPSTARKTIAFSDTGMNAITLQGRALANTAPSNGYVISWDATGNTWKPVSVSAVSAASNPWHGVVSRPVGATNPLPTTLTTTTFTLGATANNISYYYQGTLVDVSADKTATLDDGAGGSTAGLYFVYFNAGTGGILATKTHPGLTYSSNVIIATVMWNGTDYGLVNDERHNYTRDMDWHVWAHFTVGARYVSGITLTHNGGTGAATTFSTTSGEIRDEDIAFVVNASSAFPTANTCRLVYQSGATAYTFDSTASTVPWKRGVNNRPVVVQNSDYTVQELPSATNRYINFFVYATTDLHTPIYIFAETVSTAIVGQGGYTNVTNARAIPFPNLSSMGIGPELRPLYRIIVRADGVTQAIDTTLDDYRTVTSIPQGAGTVSTTASAVTFTATTNNSATNVQNAIEAVNPMSAAGDIIIGGTSGEATRLAKSTDGKVLKLVSGAPAWADESGGSGGGASAPVAVTSGTLNVTSSHNGKLITNAGATGDIILSLASVATLGNAFECAVVNEASLCDSNKLFAPYSTLFLLHGNGSNDGTTITDSSPYNRTITRDTVVTKTGEKKLGSASLYMTGGKLTFTAGSEFALSGDFTFALWAKLPYDSGVQSILRLDDAGAANTIQFSSNNNGELSVWMNGSSIGSSTGQVPDDTWAHLAWIRTSGTLKLYINGVEKGSGTASNTLVYGTATIGQNSGGQEYVGYMDEMIFAPVALPIATIYDATKEFGIGYAITTTPNSSDTLPNTASVGNSIQSVRKNDYIKIRTTDDGLIVESVYPALANWVDLLD